MQTDKIRLAIIGCGGMAWAHLNAYIYLKNQGIDIFDFVAMCDVDENRVLSPEELQQERIKDKDTALLLNPPSKTELLCKNWCFSRIRYRPFFPFIPIVIFTIGAVF